MYTITMFMLGESVSNAPGPNGATAQLVAPMVALRPAYIPGNFSFGIAVGVQGVNPSDPNRIRFEILAPNGDAVQQSTEILLPSYEQDDILPPEHQGFTLTLDIRNMRVPENGVYKFCLFVNGQTLTPQEFAVYRGAM